MKGIGTSKLGKIKASQRKKIVIREGKEIRKREEERKFTIILIKKLSSTFI